MMRYTWIPEGVGLDRLLDEWAVGDDGPKCVQLCGELQSVDLKLVPGKKVLSLKGPIYLSHGTYIRRGKAKTIMGVVSCVAEKHPRVLAGSMNRLVSGGVHAYAVPIGEAGEASRDPAGRPISPGELPVPMGAEEAFDQDELPTLAPDDSLDDRALLHSTTEMPKLSTLPKVGTSAGWGAAVAASDETGVDGGGQRADGGGQGADGGGQGAEDEPALKPGDILLHPRFGRCRVARGPMFGKVKVRRPTGALIDLHLKVLSFTRNPDEDGARVYALKIGRRPLRD